MQQVLKQSTAATTVVGPAMDSTGAAYTGLVIGDLNITKNGTTAAMAAAATLTHDHNGHYILVFTTGNTDTLGRLDVTCNKATYAMPPKCFEVLAAAAFDTLVTNGTLASTTSGRTITTAATGEAVANLTQIDGLATNGNNATLSLKSLNINATGSGLNGVFISGGTNVAAVSIAGAGSGDGIDIQPGATGHGVVVNGGITSGSALKLLTFTGDSLVISPTAGHGINVTANGTSKHGVFVTGGTGGTSDGIKAVAGTGGVPIRGDITGNITGNVSGSVGSLTTNNDKTGYSLSNGSIVAATFGAGAIDAAAIADGAIDNATFAADTGRKTIRSSTAQAGAAGSITLDASASATDNLYRDAWVITTGGTGVGQCKLITGYTGSSKIATITPNWITTPDNTTTFAVVPAAYVAGVQGNVSGSVGSVTGAVGSVTGSVTVGTNNDKTGYSLTQAFPTNFSSLAITAGGAVTAGTVSDKTGYSLTQAFPSNFSAMAITAGGLMDITQTAADKVWSTTTRQLTGTQTFNVTGNITGNLSGSVGSVTGAVGSVTGAVGSVGTGGITAATFAAGAIDASAIATDAITSAELATTAVSEIASGVWTYVIENSKTAEQFMRIIKASAAGKLSGAATTTITIRDDADTKARVTATVDSSGNRSAVTLDGT